MRLNESKTALASVNERILRVKIAYDIIDNLHRQATSLRNIVLSEDEEFLKEEINLTHECRKEFHDSLKKLAAMSTSEKETEFMNRITHQIEILTPLNNKAIELGSLYRKYEASELMQKEIEKPQRALFTEIETMIRHEEDLLQNETDATSGAADATLFIISCLSGGALIAGASISFFLTRSITKPVHRIIEGLGVGSEQVASACSQVASSSQALAEGASEQAASIEETSSSLEEMSSMTRQNADNASQANALMESANSVIDEAYGAMKELTRSMDEIAKSSEETSKIVKTIDEIAFQTNLLALNAAVEAARAGESGAGFAVVADEVRNLALRAAQASKTTAGLIEGTVRRVKVGSELAKKANGVFDEVANSAAKVGDLVAEIAAASSEQAQGIEQVNKAVSEMDKVVQQNASGAEESASASEEMNAQAEQMKNYVRELVLLITGKSNGHFAEMRPAHFLRENQYGDVDQAAVQLNKIQPVRLA
jgi:methyl-accepting chemotaxis protein